jgi:hypothetical protein
VPVVATSKLGGERSQDCFLRLSVFLIYWEAGSLLVFPHCNKRRSVVILDPNFQSWGSRMTVRRQIFAVLRRAKSYLANGANIKSNRISTIGNTDRRRTPRVHVHIPLFVYGHTPEGDPFHEDTWTISINGAGGLISMSSRVQPGQKLALTNQGNDQTEQCIVVSVMAGSTDGSKIALKFPRPMPQFWRELEIGKSR